MLQVFSQSLFGLQLVSFNMHCPGVRHGNFHDVGNSPGENPEHEGKTMFCMGKRAPNSGSWSREEHSHLQDLGTATPEVTGNQTQGETCKVRRNWGQVALQMGTTQSIPQPWPSRRHHSVKPWRMAGCNGHQTSCTLLPAPRPVLLFDPGVKE